VYPVVHICELESPDDDDDDVNLEVLLTLIIVVEANLSGRNAEPD
jgi:hypothetical protein